MELQGGAFVKVLLDNDLEVKAFVVRDTIAPHTKLLEDSGAILVKGDLNVSASIKNALVDAEGVFVALPSSGQGAVYNISDSDEDEIRIGKKIVTLAQEADANTINNTGCGSH